MDTTKTKHIDEVVVLGYNRKFTKSKDVSASCSVRVNYIWNKLLLVDFFGT
ncbi:MULTISPECIES: hypothetical protein [unclassified Elizabethkingia]|uniref:hypothetical protein n=1 Tax=Elizabethkingia sp. YR214 TaxID=2135667 RepID=UPI00130492F8